MDVIGFIERDVKRAGRLSPVTVGTLGVFAAALPVVLGILMRDDLHGVFELRTFVPNLLAALIAGWIFVLAIKRKGFAQFTSRFGFLGLGAAVFLATERVFFPIGDRTIYSSTEAFWRENLLCLTKGGVTTFVAGSGLILCGFALTAWPSRWSRVLFSTLAGVMGTVMLGFHCDSSSFGHVVYAHLGQGVLAGAVIFVAQEILFYNGVKRVLGGARSKLRSLHRLG